MSKSGVTIAKEIAKENYYNSPIGKAEKSLRDFYTKVERKQIIVSEEDAKQISSMRDDGNKLIEEYTKEQNAKIKALGEERQKVIDESSIKVDELLLNQMNKELELINKYNQND